MEKQLSITESEWTVMKVIWSAPPKTLQEILSRLEHTAWSSTTIQTYLARLVKKGALTTRRQGKGYLYFPAVSERDCQLAEGRSFLKRVYDGSLAQMVQGFVRSGSLSEEELRELKKLVIEQENSNADHRQSL